MTKNQSRGTQRQAERLQRQHHARKAIQGRQDQALTTQDETLLGQKVWIIPSFDAEPAEREYIINAVRDTLPEYYCELILAPGITQDDIHQLMVDATSDEEVGDEHE